MESKRSLRIVIITTTGNVPFLKDVVLFATAKTETAMSIKYGVLVSAAVRLASTVFCRGRAARCVMQGPTVPGTARGTNHVELPSKEET